MKRRIAWLLACSMIMMCILPVHATENGFSGNETGTGYTAAEEQDGNGSSRDNEQGETSSPAATASAAESSDQNAQEGMLPSASPEGSPQGEEDGEKDAAEEDEQGGESPEPSVTDSILPVDLSSLEDAAWNRGNAPATVRGGIEVILRNALPAEIRVVVTVKKGDVKVKGSTDMVSLGKDAQKHLVHFDDLEPGNYSLELSAPGFLTYCQDIEVSGDIEIAEIHTGFVELEGFSYERGKPHPGVMLIGDVNGDGAIDDKDKSAITEAIKATENGAGGEGAAESSADGAVRKTDLDGSGKTDLVDLQLFANSRAKLNAGADTVAVLSHRIAPGSVQGNYNSATTTVEGDLSSLLEEDGTGVTLKNRGNAAISETAPVEIGFQLLSAEQEQNQEGRQIEQIVFSMEGEQIRSGMLVCETDGEPLEVTIQDGKPLLASKARTLSGADSAGGQESRLVIDLRGQIAVKKVTFRITGMEGDVNLARISQVEFLNDLENRIPEPEMNIPTGLKVSAADKAFMLTWDAQRNITGYEVEIGYGGKTEVVRAASNSLEVKSFQGSKLKNNESYAVRVCSVNGNWRSPYSEPKSAVPVVTKKPSPPDNVKATGGYRCVRMTWKDMEDTDTYNVFYKKAGDGSFTKIEGIEQNKYEITGLEDQTVYEVYVTGVNELGESGPSLHAQAQTIILKPAQMPEYKLINKSNGKGKVSAHIQNVTHVRGGMISSPLDSSVPAEGNRKSALGTVDKDYGSSYQILDWDDGAAYVSADKGLLFTLDDYYKMSYITFAETEDIAGYGMVSVFYYDKEHPKGTYAEQVNVLQRTDVNGRKFYLIKLARPITANKIRLGFARGYNLRNIVIAEVNFYHYDSLEDDILALYGDDLHTTLRDEVTRETVDGLQKRLDTVDAESGEYHPERTVLQKELDNARGLLESGFYDVVRIDPRITAQKDSHLGFGGLNAWQPLGVTAYEGEKLIIYVGHNQLKTGANSALKLIATQYHAEAGAFAKEVATLKVGRNEVTIPSIQSLAFEGGGPLYIQYTGNNENDRYAVRVNGGADEPVLNLYGVTDEERRKELVTDYVTALDAHVAAQKELHKQLHETTGESNKVNRDYDKQNCILGATDIVLDQMMLSVSAEQILAGLGSGDVKTRADKLSQSLRAMDEMMDFFYQHKGLSADANAPVTDRVPARHLNIRYMRMFAGAFMYASGNHIGIEWGSVPGLAGASPVVSENGRYVSGKYFGWGVAHEIGHNINQGSYALAEVTNNYFAQLAQAKDSNGSVRFKYPEVYKKVTSGTVGYPTNVFTHLAMYWQLHLAYDRGYNYKTYDTWKEQFDNLFYARVDSYSRNPSSAPGNLKLDGGRDQNIMRLACAAAGKDLTEFFMRWGLVPDTETIRYSGQFPKEERALYYLTDDARAFEIERGGAKGSIEGSSVIGADSTAAVDARVPNKVNLSISCSASADVILGYEIVRYHYEDGKPVRQVVGFSTENTWSDTVSTVNNRVMTYEVIAVDKFGYRSAPAVIGDVRISHDGSHDKSMWTITTNMLSEEDQADKSSEEDPCAPETISDIYKIVDNDYRSTYKGQSAGGDAAVLLSLNQVLTVCGLKYTIGSGNPQADYVIEVSVDGKTWTRVKTGRFDGDKESKTVYFENEAKDSWICTCDAAYVRLKVLGQSSMSISEIDLLGPTGDNISFGVREGDTRGAVGILTEAYTYEQKPGAEPKVIPEGSLVFTGSYKGNPAYNVVVLYDEEGSIVGGVNENNELVANQIILANVPEAGKLGEVSDGIWIYWIEPESGETPVISGTVRAQLYRVNDALTNEGQRLVSDTMPLKIPARPDSITLKDKVETQENAAAE